MPSNLSFRCSRKRYDAIAYAFQQGLSPQSIVQYFPLLTLEQLYGAIAFYLGNRAEIDAYLAAQEAAFDAMPHWCQLKTEILDKYRFYLSLDPPKSPLRRGTLRRLLSPPS